MTEHKRPREQSKRAREKEVEKEQFASRVILSNPLLCSLTENYHYVLHLVKIVQLSTNDSFCEKCDK